MNKQLLVHDKAKNQTCQPEQNNKLNQTKDNNIFINT